MDDLLNIVGAGSISRYEYKPDIAYRKGELCIHGRTVFLNLVPGNAGNHPFFSQYWQEVGRVNEISIETSFDGITLLVAEHQSEIEYITATTIDGAKQIQVTIIE